MKNLRKLALVNQDVDTSFFTLEAQWHGLRNPAIKNQIGICIKTSVEEILQGKTINTYMEEKELRDFIHTSAQALLGDRSLVLKYKRNTILVSQKIRELAITHHRRVHKLNSRQLADLLSQFNKLQIKSMLNGTVVAFADIYGEIGNALTKIVSKRKKLKFPLSTYTSTLGQPEEKSLSELAYEKIATTTHTEKILLKELFWLEQGYIGRGLTSGQLKAIRKSHQQVRHTPREPLEKELRLNPAEKLIFHTVKDIITIKSLRADSRQFAYVVLNEILDTLAKKWQVKPAYLETLSIPEIRSILLNKARVPDNLSQRWFHSVLIPKKRGGYEVLLGGKASNYLEKNLLKETISNSNIKGQIAYTGKAKGKVRLVFGPQHNNKVKKGDILVSTATSPQLLPAMKLAAAFVTDVGGITSHAAIVARELKKPCIVGTKHATQILNDGDIIEVDANLGVVKKL
jgi:phosphohistidine swiveling domain-containing protein